MHVMQSKLTLRLDESLIRKAKLLAVRRGTSVSRIFGEYIAKEVDIAEEGEYPPLTSKMLGLLKSEGEAVGSRKEYRSYLEEKYQ